MGLLPCANSSTTKEFNAREAIMEVVPLHFPIIIHLCIRLSHFFFDPHQAHSLELGSVHCYSLCNFTISIILSMPRERGKSCRGPAWYIMATKAEIGLQRLERALSIARTQRTQIACKDGSERMAWSPPTKFVEEVISEEPIQLPLKTMLFMVPKNWQPPTNFPKDETREITTAHHSTCTMDSKMEEFPICYIEEELPKECLQMAAHDDIISAGLAPFTVSEHEGDLGSIGTGAEDGAEERSARTDHQVGAKEGMWAEKSEAGGGGTSKEGGEVLASPAISTTPDQWHVPPPFFHPEQFNLVFDLRRQMADQVYRGTLMSQCIDMLYEAFSNAPTKQRCPTCARLYALPAQNEMPNEDLDSEDLNG